MLVLMKYCVATLTITASAGVGGLISPNGATTVLYSSNKTYTITANTGYCIQDVLVDGVSVGAVASYTFTGIISSHTIAASFVARTTASVSIIAARNNVCYGATTYIIATPTNGGTAPMYNFYVDGVAQGNSAVARFNTSLLSVGLHAVYCVMTSNNICQTSNIANSNAININVGNITVLPSIGGATSACVLGIGSRLFNTVGGGVWSSSNLGVATINNSTGIATGVSAGVSVITYTYTNSFGCVNTANTNFNVAPIGNVEQITGATGLCVGSTITLSNATTGGVWSSIAGRAIINASGIVTATSAGVAQIRYTVSNAFGCNAYVGRNITVNAIPAQPRIAYAVGTVNPQTGAGGAFCNGRTFTLVGTPSGGVWSTSNPVVITINNSTGVANTIGVGIGSITYTYTLSGCSNARAITGTVANCPSPRGNNNNDRLPIDVYQNSFDLYPNPANSVVSLNVNQLIGNGSIVVTDLYGKQIKIQPLSMGKNDIAVSKFSKGFYFVSVIANGNMQTHKLIVE